MPGLQWMEGGKISRLHSVDGTRGYEGKKKEKKRETKGLLNPPSVSSLLLFCRAAHVALIFPVQSKFCPQFADRRSFLSAPGILSERRVTLRRAVATDGRRSPRMLFSAPRPRNYEGPRERRARADSGFRFGDRKK